MAYSERYGMAKRTGMSDADARLHAEQARALWLREHPEPAQPTYAPCPWCAQTVSIGPKGTVRYHTSEGRACAGIGHKVELATS